MKVETKFNIGDNMWVVNESKATCIEVKVIVIFAAKVCYGNNHYSLYPEDFCFPTKEALLSFIAND